MSETLNYKVMTVDPPMADQLGRWCEEPPTGCGRGEVIFDEEVHFLDKYFMVVQVTTSEEPDGEPCWTQGVLFNEQGRECGFTEPREEFLGEYRVGNYCVKVEKEDA
tara:strand:+ start:196 stop:516 length:321 start_codon:yes stop_codon:yes gene_type:complete